jgi:hypothetical protein
VWQMICLLHAAWLRCTFQTCTSMSIRWSRAPMLLRQQGTVCCPVGLAFAGRQLALASGVRLVGATEDQLIVFEAIAGFLALAARWMSWGVVVEVYLGSEVDKAALRVVRRVWSDSVELGDINFITDEQLLDIRNKRPVSRLASSLAEVHRKGLADHRSALVWALIALPERLRRLFPDVYWTSSLRTLNPALAMTSPSSIAPWV